MSSTAGAVIVSPSSKPKFSLLRTSNSPRSSAPSNRVPFSHRMFEDHPISLPETSTSPKDIPNQLDRWSVNFDSNVEPVLNVKLEYVLTPGGTVWRVRFSPDGKYLAVGVDNGGTYIYDVKTGTKSWSVTLFWFRDVNVN